MAPRGRGTPRAPWRAGLAERPIFSEDGDLPLSDRRGGPNVFEALLEVARAHPGKACMVAHFTHGWVEVGTKLVEDASREATGNTAKACRTSLQHYLRARRPLENWNCRVVTPEGTWSERQVWVRFNGMYADLAERRSEIERRMGPLYGRTSHRSGPRGVLAQAIPPPRSAPEVSLPGGPDPS